MNLKILFKLIVNFIIFIFRKYFEYYDKHTKKTLSYRNILHCLKI